MSSLCPQCGNSIEQDFGVATCSQCQSVLFIDMDGKVTTSPSLSSESEPLEEPAQSFENVALEVSEHFQTEQPGEFQENWMMPDPSHPVPTLDSAQDEISLEARGSESEFQQADGSMEQEESSEEIHENSFDEPLIEDPHAHNFDDVSNFANSDQALGSLVYTVFIENIDTKETRELLVEALSDSKFRWDSKELLKQVKMGKLKLENLNPVKASVLVYRLQDLPVKVSWIQNAYA